ncbi:response regulator [Pseudoduganella ginsengisoli]|nr:response regulator [Pseudoduganella ginsengisoli]
MMDRRPSKDFWLTVVSASLMLALIWAAVWRIDGSERERFLQDQRAAVQSKVGGIRAELEKTLNQRLHLVRGLAAFARSQPKIDRQAFEVYARELLGSQAGIMSLQLAPGGVISYLYPLAGNEGAQGHDLLRDQRARSVILEMLETREFRLAGPMPLRQGGVGLIGRMPIYTSTAAAAAAAFQEGELASEHRPGTATAMAQQAGRTGLSSPVPPSAAAGEHFWGFATVLINWTDLLRDTGLSDAVADVEWALRGKDGKGAQGDVIAGDPALFGPAQPGPDSVLATVSLPAGYWQLAGRPAGGWSATWPGRSMLYAGAALLSVLVLVITWMQLKYRRALELARAAEQAARWAAEAASQAKSDFLANVSHEVRTPINAVIGFTQLALRASPEPKVKSYLQKVQGSTYILLNLINDILDLSKIEANRLELERVPFNLEDVFSNIANVIALQASQKGLELAFHLDPAIPGTLIGDPLRLGQALANLVVNAVKFTEQGEVVVTAELAGPVGPDTVAVRFHVRDTGIGIPHDKLEKLFTPFTQADSSITRRFGGTGLGLSITKELVGRMGGQMGVASEPGAGSTFSFTLCLAYGDSRRAAFCPLLEGRGLRVLVVDDNLSAREILSETLRGVARTVVAAESGEEALALLGDAASPAPYDVILLDWRMPGLDGLETGRRIAARYAGSVQPTLLMVSAYDGEAVRQEAESAGIRRFLTKPVNPSALLDTVLELIGQHDLAPGLDDGGFEQRMARWQRALNGRTVMVAEDNRVNQEVLQGLLEQVGVSVVLAQHGEDALEKLYRMPVDAVLMDLQMPRLDGLQATAIIRQDAAWRRLPIIAMTAHAQASDRERCLAVGMNAHLTKPIDPEQLYRTLEEWLPAQIALDAAPPATTTGVADQGPELPATLPGIDIAAALKVVAGNRANFVRIARRFTADFMGVADALMRHAAIGEWGEASRLAHALKGAAGNSGALAVFHAAAALERLCAQIAEDGGENSVQESGAAALVERIRTGMAEVQDSVAQLEVDRTMPENSGAVALHPAAQDGGFAALLDDAAQRLKTRRLVTEEQIATMRALCSADARPALETFIQALDRFDYREAETALAQVRSQTASCST